jgi:hypothetical protein
MIYHYQDQQVLEIKASLRRKIEQKLGIEGGLDALEDKTKDLFKGFGF